MDTIQHLRKQVGQASLLMAGAAAIIVDEQDRHRLLKRSESGCWDPLEWRAYRLGLVLSRDIPEDLSPPIKPVIAQFVTGYCVIN